MDSLQMLHNTSLGSHDVILPVIASSTPYSGAEVFLGDREPSMLNVDEREEIEMAVEKSNLSSDPLKAGANFTGVDLSQWYGDLWVNVTPNGNYSTFYGGNSSFNNETVLEEERLLLFCDHWEVAQHNLFQTANLFVAAAFLVPKSFKQNLLLLRGLLCIGFFLSAIWAGIHDCAPDVFFWNVGLVFLNALHTALLTCRFLPPPLSPELTELYMKMFKPLRVSKKHFKELSREAEVLTLEEGDTYAIEELTVADERLSILLTGKLRVTCEDTHLHYITPHQFVDSPEWEANHENSDDVFQVTITAEVDCSYLCWSRLKLERVLRHRPMLKTIVSNMIGKDITHKLYSLNEHLDEYENGGDVSTTQTNENWKKALNRSLSMDAVHMGTRGHVRSNEWRAQQQRRTSTTFSDRSSPSRGLHQQQCWVPVVASHFPATTPFTHYVRHEDPAMPRVPTQTMLLPAPVVLANIIVPVLGPPPTGPARSRSVRKPGGREVKFEVPP